MSLEFPEERDPLTEKIIGCAIEVHRTLGRDYSNKLTRLRFASN